MPGIRPLETLHNALSLRQMDSFLGFVTSATFQPPSPSPDTVTADAAPPSPAPKTPPSTPVSGAAQRSQRMRSMVQPLDLLSRETSKSYELMFPPNS